RHSNQAARQVRMHLVRGAGGGAHGSVPAAPALNRASRAPLSLPWPHLVATVRNIPFRSPAAR
ncbi:hypothetical protein ACUW9Q_004766, partial [Ralstonia pickettii]